jgi:hypothetical protein
LPWEVGRRRERCFLKRFGLVGTLALPNRQIVYASLDFHGNGMD